MSKNLWILALLLAAGCPEGDTATVRFHLASTTPRAGFEEARRADDSSELFLLPDPLLTEEDIADVQPYLDEKDGDDRIEVICHPHADEKVKNLLENHADASLALRLDGKIVAVTRITREYGEGLLVIRDKLPKSRLYRIAVEMGHG
jgi:hypothetical protein